MAIKRYSTIYPDGGASGAFVPLTNTITINGDSQTFGSNPVFTIPIGGLTSLNLLTAAAQTLEIGSAGLDFGISSSGTAHTFNIPTASAAARGLLSSANWSTFNGKQNALTGTGFVKSTAGVISYDNSTYVPTSRTITVNGSTQALTSDVVFSISGLTALNALVASTQNFAIGTTGVGFNINSTGSTHTFNLPFAGTLADGQLSSADWINFNSKVPAARSLTINGITQDLSANRTFTISAAPDLPILDEGISLTTTPNSLNFTGGAVTTSVLSGAVTINIQQSINGLTGGVQTFVPGTLGTDFNIDSTGTTHTFNFPNASAANRGLLTAANWITFNNKVAPTRALTINGITQDLSADRTFTITATPDLPIYEEGNLLVATPASVNFVGRDITSTVLGADVTVTVANVISSLNLQTNNIQTLVPASTGVDFTISSTGGIHTFAIPSASAGARGLLTAANWTTFNNKVNPSRALTINGITQDLSADRDWTISVATDLEIFDEGISLTPTPTSINFIGAGVSVSNSLNAITVTIPQGLTNLNGLTTTNQTFNIGTLGTDFGIVSAAGTHTFNLPSASAANRGLLTSANWTTFNNKQDALTGTGFVISTAGVITYDPTAYVPTSTIITINGVAQDLSANRTWTIVTGGGPGGGGSGSCDINWDTIDLDDWDALNVADICAQPDGITIKSAGTVIGFANNIREIDFISGATVAAGVPGTVEVTLTGGSGLTVDASRQSTDTHTISFGDKYFAYTATSSNLIWVVGSRVQCTFNINNYIEAVVISTNTTGVTVAPYKIIGSGTYSAWVISLAAGGNDGLAGDMTRESASSIGIGGGTKTFAYTVVSNNIGWVIGTRLRVSYSVNPTLYMEGIITAVGSGSVTINSDAANGSGTYNSWNIGVTGERGLQGVPGFSTSTSLDLYNYYNLI